MRISNFLRYMDGPGGRRSQNGKIQVRFFSDFSEQIKTKKVLKKNDVVNKLLKNLNLLSFSGNGFEKCKTSHRSDSFVCNHGFGYDLGGLLLLPFGLINHRCQLEEGAHSPRVLQEQAIQILQLLRN